MSYVPERDGLSKIIGLAKTICRITQAFRTIITRKYGDNPIIVGLLDAIDVLCGLLADADAVVNGVVENDLPADSTEVPGYNPLAPVRPEFFPEE